MRQLVTRKVESIRIGRFFLDLLDAYIKSMDKRVVVTFFVKGTPPPWIDVLGEWEGGYMIEGFWDLSCSLDKDVIFCYFWLKDSSDLFPYWLCFSDIEEIEISTIQDAVSGS